MQQFSTSRNLCSMNSFSDTSILHFGEIVNQSAKLKKLSKDIPKNNRSGKCLKIHGKFYANECNFCKVANYKA